MMSILLNSSALYHPPVSIGNDHYIRHFAERGKDIGHFLDVMGRRSRYIITDPSENGLTMAAEASRRALDKSGLAAEDLDMIVFSTQTPEYTFPTNALLLHKELGGKNEVICLDSNSNCAGMVVAVEQACRYMSAHPGIRYALIAGSDYNSIHCNPEDEITYANYGDAAAAVILERAASPGSGSRGFMDSLYYADTSSVSGNILFPACGTSGMYREDLKPDDLRIRWIPFDGTVCVDPAVRSIRRLLEQHGLEPGDVSAFFMSQFALKNVELIAGKLGLSMDKFVYVGDEFGYTGTSSPYIALARAEEQGRIRRGDLLIFWSVGAGWQIVTLLVQY